MATGVAEVWLRQGAAPCLHSGMRPRPHARVPARTAIYAVTAGWPGRVPGDDRGP
jgi:hypothetical protein